MKNFRLFLITVAMGAFLSAAYLSITEDQSAHPTPILVTPYQSDEALNASGSEQISKAKRPTAPIRVHYIVKVGDTLSDIFSAWQLPYEQLMQVMVADQATLQLDTIKPGDYLEFEIDAAHRLERLTFHVSLVEKAIYTKASDNGYTYSWVEQEGEWRDTIYSGEINGSFSLSAHNLGLSSNQIGNITRVLRDKVNFNRSLRAGDRFDVMVKEQFLNGHPTGNSEIQAISFHLARGEVSAFLAKDGRFYDRDGQSLERAFNRYPIDRQYRRITSAFNPKRKHPVTGRISPHNGTDFATPVGAPIYSIGDGKVVGIRNHPYAGKYLVIEHNSIYTTRYLHLSRFLVKKGQYVKRGQKIALSGATGRLTGPHLHFEVLVRNRAVDPMKANLPLASAISNKEKAAFLARVEAFDRKVTKERKS